MKPRKFLVALPVYNERRYVADVLAEVLRFAAEVLVVDDGSTDGTSEFLSQRRDIHLVRHRENMGYGAALRTAFQFAIGHHFEVLVTMDCDGQHEPRFIPQFVEACEDADIVSGSRYLERFPGDSEPPADRRRINELITSQLNEELGLNLTDAFCGFKAYRTEVLQRFEITEDGYAMPLEIWVQAAQLKLRIVELAIPLVYLDMSRSFGGALDNAETRLEVYRTVLARSLERYRVGKSCLLNARQTERG